MICWGSVFICGVISLVAHRAVLLVLPLDKTALLWRLSQTSFYQSMWLLVPLMTRIWLSMVSLLLRWRIIFAYGRAFLFGSDHRAVFNTTSSILWHLFLFQILINHHMPLRVRLVSSVLHPIRERQLTWAVTSDKESWKLVRMLPFGHQEFNRALWITHLRLLMESACTTWRNAQSWRRAVILLLVILSLLDCNFLLLCISISL